MDRRPNILFILVDELRYWRVPFPDGIHSVDGFLREFMPNTHKLLWERGVKRRTLHGRNRLQPGARHLGNRRLHPAKLDAGDHP
jgi:hypothetical protein